MTFIDIAIVYTVGIIVGITIGWILTIMWYDTHE